MYRVCSGCACLLRSGEACGLPVECTVDHVCARHRAAAIVECADDGRHVCQRQQLQHVTVVLQRDAHQLHELTADNAVVRNAIIMPDYRANAVYLFNRILSNTCAVPANTVSA